MARHNVYRFYAELRDYEPRIWRRFEINGEKTMAELAYTLMLMFEMQASHLFSIEVDGTENILAVLRAKYNNEEEVQSAIEFISSTEGLSDCLKDERYDLPPFDDLCVGENVKLYEANKVKLDRVSTRPGWKAVFSYDFGDGWEVDLFFEGCEKREVLLSTLPNVLEGEGYGIIEDVGGVYELEGLAKILKKGKGKDYKAYCEWLGTDNLDLTEFDIEDMNFRLKKLIRVYRDCYEYDLKPTARSMNLLLREYKGKGPRGY